MNVLKQILKFTLSLTIGIGIGLAIGGVISLLFTDISFGEYIAKLGDIEVSEGVLVLLVTIAAMVLSFMFLVITHEAGHLVCGLLSGYRFVSFRILNYTIIRIGGKLRVKKFAIAGTGGQCLLCPPDLPVEKIPTGWYNMGGLLANALALAIVAPLLWANLHPLLMAAIGVFCIVDVILLLLNGIPISMGGFSNDASNALMLSKNIKAKRALMIQLRSNAMIQEGVRPRDMPAEWFRQPETVDYRNPLEVSLPLLGASRLIDEERWEEAYDAFSKVYAHKDSVMGLYVKETAQELAFCALVTGRKDEAERLLDKELRKYIEMYRRMMSSKERILCAASLYLDNEPDVAMEIYRNLEQKSDGYLLQGEVKSDLAIMKKLLDSYPSLPPDGGR